MQSETMWHIEICGNSRDAKVKVKVYSLNKYQVRGYNNSLKIALFKIYY